MPSKEAALLRRRLPFHVERVELSSEVRAAASSLSFWRGLMGSGIFAVVVLPLRVNTELGSCRVREEDARWTVFVELNQRDA